MVRGQGESNGPDLSGIGRELTLAQLEQALEEPAAWAAGRSGGACPSWAWCPGQGWSLVNVRLQDGSSVRGLLRSQGKHDLQLQTLDGHLRLLLDTEYREISREPGSYMPALKASNDERRDLLAYLSRLDGVTAGPLAKEQAPIPTSAIDQILNPKPANGPRQRPSQRQSTQPADSDQHPERGPSEAGVDLHASLCRIAYYAAGE